MKSSHLENKANNLWRKFDRNSPQDFWQNYDLLLANSRHVTVSGPTRQNITTTEKAQVRIFHPGIFYYISKFTWIGLVFFLGILIFKDNFPRKDMSGFFVFLSLSLTFTFRCFWTINSFEITPKTFVIRKKLLSIQKKIAWQRIQSIGIQEDQISSSENTTLRFYVCVIKTTSGKTYSYRYNLSQKSHQTFIKTLKPKVPWIDVIRYVE